jgi:hypothetical protein
VLSTYDGGEQEEIAELQRQREENGRRIHEQNKTITVLKDDCQERLSKLLQKEESMSSLQVANFYWPLGVI